MKKLLCIALSLLMVAAIFSGCNSNSDAAKIEKLIDSEEFKAQGEAKEVTEENKTKWVCEICGHVHYGDNPPDTCPLCGVPSKMFKKAE